MSLNIDNLTFGYIGHREIYNNLSLKVHNVRSLGLLGNNGSGKTTFAGLCHSDLHQIDGYFDLGGDEKLNVGARKKLPFCVGHEIEGEVIAVGKNAKGKVNIGQSYGIYVSSKIQNLKQRYSL